MSAVMLTRVRAVARPCLRYKSVQSKVQSARESRMLDRMIKKSVYKTKPENCTQKKIKQEFLTSAYANEASNRKIASLNKFYMEHLLELINSGPYTNGLAELGIQFSKVRIATCRSSINIYWASTKEGISETEVAKVLQETKKDLQEQMGFIRPMGKVPFVTFVKDVRLEKAQNVEKLFEVADFGKDHEMSNPRRVVNTDLNMLQEANEEKSEELTKMENLIGFDHVKIEEKIWQNIKRFQAINIKQNEIQEVKHEHPGKLVEFSKQLFNRFYKRKIYLDRKLRSREYNDTYFDLSEPYDPEKEAEKHWEFLTGKEGYIKAELEELQEHFAKLDRDDYYAEEDDDDSNDKFESNEESKEEMPTKGEKIKIKRSET